MARRIYVAGGGYVGLVSAACYAQKGNAVVLYEKDRFKRRTVASGRSWFYEPKLDEILEDVVKTGHLALARNPVNAIANSDFHMIAVGTPTRRDGAADLSELVMACRDVAKGLKKHTRYVVVAIRSTVPPGTTSGLVRDTLEHLSGKRAGREFGLVAYPEFLREGSAVHDTLHAERVVIGELDKRSGSSIMRLLRDFYGRSLPPTVRVSPSAAEMIKYASNAFLATKIAFINEIANLCEHFENVDVMQVAEGMGHDHRIGRAFLNAGIGFGGPCLPKDLKALTSLARRTGVDLRIAETTLSSNELQPLRMIQLARESIGTLKGRTGAVLGLAFKPSTSDMRVAPSVKIVRALIKAGMRVKVYDPAATKNAKTIFGRKVIYCKDISECLTHAHCCFIVTEWDEFKRIPPNLFMQRMANPVVIDGRRLFDPALDPRITYRGIGLGGRPPEVTVDRLCDTESASQ